ncbi:MAG TPA: RNA 2',3'-cyclic phosphodiesterase [Actinomycetota bacterium]|nr:RNA 2',3'-cyclic phosphodiesterase [Actinomycetota bacterium]
MKGDPSKETLRLFIAAGLPAPLGREVALATAPFQSRWPDARWAPAANLHVTLKFLGSTPAGRLDSVAGVVEACAAGTAAGTVAVAGWGVFPSRRRARVFWVGIEDPDRILARLAGALDAGLRPLGWEPERRPFSPHLTVARFKTPRDVRSDLELATFGPRRWDVSEVRLMRSRLSPKGATYETLSRYDLPIS